MEVRLEDIESERTQTNKPQHLQQAAEYFNLYQDLFGDAYFTPVIPLSVEFSVVSKGEEVVSPVHAGNQITPFEVRYLSLDLRVDGSELIVFIFLRPTGEEQTFSQLPSQKL